MRAMLLLPLAALVLAAPRRASAQDPEIPPPAAPAPHFGARGSQVLDGATGFDAEKEFHNDSTLSHVELSGAFGWGRFVLENVSLGVDIGAGYTSDRAFDGVAFDDTKTAWFRLGPRVGLNIPLGERISFYPQLTVGVEWRRYTLGSSGGATYASVDDTSPLPDGVSTFGPYVTLDAPVLFHVAPHFFVGLGPRIYQRFADDHAYSIVEPTRLHASLALQVGGHWEEEGPPHDDAPAVSADAPPRERFGARGTLVLTNALGLSASLREYQGRDSRAELELQPGVDYFVASNVSFGFTATFAYAKSDDTHDARVEAGPRVGLNVPLGARVSFYPRFTLGAGYESESTSSHDYAWVGLSTPLLYEVAPHFFVGAGPRITQELWRHYGSGSDYARLTRLQADGLLGGWF